MADAAATAAALTTLFTEALPLAVAVIVPLLVIVKAPGSYTACIALLAIAVSNWVVVQLQQALQLPPQQQLLIHAAMAVMQCACLLPCGPGARTRARLGLDTPGQLPQQAQQQVKAALVIAQGGTSQEADAVAVPGARSGKASDSVKQQCGSVRHHPAAKTRCGQQQLPATEPIVSAFASPSAQLSQPPPGSPGGAAAGSQPGQPTASRTGATAMAPASAGLALTTAARAAVSQAASQAAQSPQAASQAAQRTRPTTYLYGLFTQQRLASAEALLPGLSTARQAQQAASGQSAGLRSAAASRGQPASPQQQGDSAASTTATGDIRSYPPAQEPAPQVPEQQHPAQQPPAQPSPRTSPPRVDLAQLLGQAAAAARCDPSPAGPSAAAAGTQGSSCQGTPARPAGPRASYKSPTRAVVASAKLRSPAHDYEQLAAAARQSVHSAIAAAYGPRLASLTIVCVPGCVQLIVTATEHQEEAAGATAGSPAGSTGSVPAPALSAVLDATRQLQQQLPGLEVAMVQADGLALAGHGQQGRHVAGAGMQLVQQQEQQALQLPQPETGVHYWVQPMCIPHSSPSAAEAANGRSTASAACAASAAGSTAAIRAAAPQHLLVQAGSAGVGPRQQLGHRLRAVLQHSGTVVFDQELALEAGSGEQQQQGLQTTQLRLVVPSQALTGPAGLLWLHLMVPKREAGSASQADSSAATTAVLPEGALLQSLPVLLLPPDCCTEVQQLFQDMLFREEGAAAGDAASVGPAHAGPAAGPAAAPLLSQASAMLSLPGLAELGAGGREQQVLLGMPRTLEDAQKLISAQQQLQTFALDLGLMLQQAAAGSAAASSQGSEEQGAEGAEPRGLLPPGTGGVDAAAAAEALLAVAASVCNFLVARRMWACCRLLDPGFEEQTGEKQQEEDGEEQGTEMQEGVGQVSAAAAAISIQGRDQQEEWRMWPADSTATNSVLMAAGPMPHRSGINGSESSTSSSGTSSSRLSKISSTGLLPAQGLDSSATSARQPSPRTHRAPRSAAASTTTAPATAPASAGGSWLSTARAVLCCACTTFLQLLLGFQPPSRESLYLGFKQQRYLLLDVASGAFTGAYLASVVGRMVRDAWTGLPAVMYLVAKLMPYCVLLANKPAFLAHREVLVVVPELFKVCVFMLCVVGVLPMPCSLLAALSRSRGDVVVTGLISPLLQHLRFRWHLALVTLEMVVMPCLFHAVVGSWRAVLLRFGVNYGLSLVVGAAVDVYARRQFMLLERGDMNGGQGLSQKKDV